MSIRRPTLDQMRTIVKDLGMAMEDKEIIEYMSLMEANFEAYDLIDSLPDFIPEVKYPRTPGYKPNAEENQLNAWYQKTDIPGANMGVLKGKRIVLKDNICLAGVPMMNGASTLEGYTPDLDATVVTRILDAGGNIAGKAHCEYFCLSGGSHTNATGPVHNPYKIGYISGGSSSGCGALIGAGEIEMAIGCDQGGSIRIPSSFCGGYGMKPTHGLVPYSGIMPIEPTIDHVGPMTTNVSDNALLLEVIAGEDGLDPRQYNPKLEKYTNALNQSIAGMRIGVLKEGFGHENSEVEVDEKVRNAANKFKALGAIVEEVSLPAHSTAVAIWTPITLEGTVNTMMHGNGFGTSWEGLYVTSLLDYHSNWRNRADELSETLKITMFVGEYMQKHYRGHYQAKAQNLSRKLKQDYNKLFEKYDLLLMPTLPITAQPIPAQNAPLAEIIGRAFEMIGNTAPFNATGHPAMSIPCGMSNGLPIGMQLVGKHYDEFTIYKAAHAFEQSGDWQTM
ncbi:MAG: amidase [Rhizobiales bacterium]|nr:amidase [Hyphomicrobiales bacterium]